MRLTPFIIIFLFLLAPCNVLASEGTGHLKVISPVESITANNLNNSNTTQAGLLNYSQINTDNDTQLTPITDDTQLTPITDDTPPTNQDTGLSMGEEMIVGGISKSIVRLANMCVSGLGGVQTGVLNNTTVAGEKVAIFAVVAHRIDPTTDPGTMEDVETCRNYYVYFMVLFALVLALFMLAQQLRPDITSLVMETATGQRGYMVISDMVEYYTITCGWLAAGPAELYCAIWLNNYLVESMMLSILDLVSFDSSNVSLYLMFVVLWLVLVAFFAMRLVSILLVVRVWYLFGLLLAVKSTRWIGLLLVAYMNGIVFMQFLLVWSAVTVVSYVNTHVMTGVSESFVYLGLFLLEVLITALVALWPFILALLSPKTWKAIITVARYTI